MLAGWHVNVSWLTSDLPLIYHPLSSLNGSLRIPSDPTPLRESPAVSIPFFPPSLTHTLSLPCLLVSVFVFVFLSLFHLLHFHQRMYHILPGLTYPSTCSVRKLFTNGVQNDNTMYFSLLCKEPFC